MRQPAVYIMFNQRNGTLYTGVTSNLIQRVQQHQQGTFQGFSNKYNCKLLGFYELHNTMAEAIESEKRIKSGSRLKKIKLIENQNPDWKDLWFDIMNG